MQQTLKSMKPELEKAAEVTAEMIQQIVQDTVSTKLPIKKDLFCHVSFYIKSVFHTKDITTTDVLGYTYIIPNICIRTISHATSTKFT